MPVTMHVTNSEKGGSGIASTTAPVVAVKDPYALSKDNPFYNVANQLKKEREEKESAAKKSKDKKNAQYFSSNIQSFVKSVNDVGGYVGKEIGSWSDQQKVNDYLGMYDSLSENYKKLQDAFVGNDYLRDSMSEEDYKKTSEAMDAIGKALDDGASYVRQAGEVYGQFGNADEYNRHVKLSGMSAENLQKMVDSLDAEREARDKSPASYEETLVAGDRVEIPTKAYEQFLKDSDAERVLYTSYLNNAKYNEGVKKYGVDPKNMTYSEIMGIVNSQAAYRRNPDVYDFVRSFYDSQNENYWYEKKAEEFVDGLDAHERYLYKKVIDMPAGGLGMSGAVPANATNPTKVNEIVKEISERTGDSEDVVKQNIELARWYFDSQKRAEQQKNISEYVGENVGNAALANTGSILIKLPAGVAAFIDQTGQTIGNKLSGTDAPVNPNTPGQSLLNVSNDIRDATRKQIEKKVSAKLPTGANLGVFVYDTIMNTADVVAQSLVGGFVGRGIGYALGLGADGINKAISATTGMIASSTAAANTVQESLEDGYSNGMAVARGAIAGAIESIVEAVQIDRLLKGLAGGDSAIKAVLKGALSEGTEEVVTNILTEDLVEFFSGNGTRISRLTAEYEAAGYSKEGALRKAALDVIGQDAETFVSAAITGAVFGGTEAAATRANDKANTKLAQDGINNRIGGIGEIEFLKAVNGEMVSAAEEFNRTHNDAQYKAVDDEVLRRIAYIQSVKEDIRNNSSLRNVIGESGIQQEIQKLDANVQTLSEIRSLIESGRYDPSYQAELILAKEEDLSKTTEEQAKSQRNILKAAQMYLSAFGSEKKAVEAAKKTAAQENARAAELSAERSRLTEALTTADETQKVEINRRLQEIGKEIKRTARNVIRAGKVEKALGDQYRSAINSALGGNEKELSKRLTNALGRDVKVAYDDNAKGFSSMKTGADSSTLTVNPELILRTENALRQEFGEEYTGNLAKEKLVHEIAHAAARSDANFDAKVLDIYHLLRDNGLITDDDIDEAATREAYKDTLKRYMATEPAKAEVRRLVEAGNAEADAIAAVENAYIGEELVAQTLEWMERATNGQLSREILGEKRNVFVQALNRIAEIFRSVAAKLKGVDNVNAAKTAGFADKIERFAREFAERGVAEMNEGKADASQESAGATQSADNAQGNSGEGAVASSESEATTGTQEEDERQSLDVRTVEAVKNSEPVSGEDEVRYSIEFNEKMMDAARRANNGAVTKRIMDKAESDRAAVKRLFTDPKTSASLGLPPDIIGKTYIPNSSYSGTEENTTVCPRSLAADALMDAVAESIGRPLTVEDTLAISQEYWKYTDTPECLYCYVAMDRKAYREFLGSYLKQRDDVLADISSGMDKEAAYSKFLDGRKPTANMRKRFDMWVRNAEKGADLISTADLASDDAMQKAAARGKNVRDQINDARKYAQSASWAKKRIGYAAYDGHILRWKQNRIDSLNSHYGLRMYSFSDFSPAFILENMQMITDAAVRKLKILAYTKDLNFVKIFAKTGMNINVSVFAHEGKNGVMAQDGMQGADWTKARKLRDEYGNVGITFVATNDGQVDWALAQEQDWIDVVIPFHLVRTGAKVADSFGWKNYTAMSSDVKTKAWTSANAASVYPTEHQNNKEKYFEALRKNNLEPRFAQWAENPNYMKLVNETRQSAAETSPVQPVFDLGAAEDAIEEMRKRGGYYVPIGGSEEVMREIADEIASGIDGDERHSLATSIYIKDGHTDNGETVDFVNLILDGKKKGETRTHKSLTRKWVGIAKDGYVYGRVRFGDPYLIDKDSPEYADSYIEGTEYDIADGEQKYYYPILEVEDFRDAPKPITKHGNYAQYEDEDGGEDAEDVRYSYKFTTDGRPVAVIEEDILNGVPQNEWRSVAKKVLSKRFPDGVMVNGELVKVNRDSRNEFAKSAYSERLRRKKIDRFADKMRLAASLDDVIIASTNRIRDGVLLHDRDDNYVDFSHGDVLLLVDGKKYKADVVIGYTDQGETVFYDVVRLSPTTFDIKNSGNNGHRDPASASPNINVSATGKSVPQPEQKVKTSGEDSRSSLVLDSDYMSAIKRGDMAEVQRMVDEAAKAAGYAVKAYHGTPDFGFTVFDPSKSDDNTTLFFTESIDVAKTYAGRDVGGTKDIKDAKSFEYERGRKYTEEELKAAHDYVQKHYHVYGNTKINVEKQTVTHAGTRYSAKQIMDMADRIAKKGIYGVYLNTDGFLVVDANGERWSAIDAPEDFYEVTNNNLWGEKVPFVGTRDYARYAKLKGYRGITFKNVHDIGSRNTPVEHRIVKDGTALSTIHVLFDSNQVKSADPVTYDDNGNVIPLSERFNTDNEDIRYSLSDEQRMKRQAENIAFLKKQIQRGRSYAVSPSALDKVWTELRRGYGIDKADEQTVRDMFKIVDDMSMHKMNADEGMARLNAMAREVLTNVYQIDDHLMRENEAFIQYIRSTPLSVPADNESDLGGKYGDYRNANRRYVNLSREGTPVDSVYEQICDMFPGILNRSLKNPVEQIHAIVKEMRKLDPVDKPKYSDTMDSAAESFVSDVMAKMDRYSRKTFRSKSERDKEILRENAERQAAAERNRSDVLRAREAEEYEKRVKRMETQNRNTVNAYEARIQGIETAAARDAKEYERLLDRYMNRVQRLEDRERVRTLATYSDDIRRDARAIRSAAVSPNQKKFVPEDYRSAVQFVANWLEAVSRDGKKLGEPSDSWAAFPYVRSAFQNLTQLYGEDFGAISSTLLNQMESFVSDLSKLPQLSGSGVSSTAPALTNQVAEYSGGLSDLGKATVFMQDAYKLGRLLRKAIIDQNRMVLDGKIRGANYIAGELVDDLNNRRNVEKEFNTLETDEKGRIRSSSDSGKILERMEKSSRKTRRWISLNTMDGYSFLRRMGKVGDALYDTLRAAQSEQIMHVQEYVKTLQDKLLKDQQDGAKGVDLSRYIGDKQKTVTVTLSSGKKYTMTAAQAMTIVTLYEREAGKSHIENGGVRLVHPKDKTLSAAVALKAEDVAAIAQNLDEDDRRVMKVMNDFIREQCTEWGNEATLVRYGFHRFNAQHYFPITVDRNALPSNVSAEGAKDYLQFNVQNVGFAKAADASAKAPVVIDSFISVINRHVEGMATYAAYLNAEDIVNRLMSAPGVKDAMQRSLGTGSVKYMTDMMTELKQGNRGGSEDSLTQWWNKSAGHYKSAAVSYNLSTALKQPLSIIRAAAVLDPKYILAAKRVPFSGTGKAAHEEMMQYSGIGVKKSVGYSDVGISRDINAQIGYEKKDLSKKVRNVSEFGMALAGYMDETTWDSIWIACREEVKDKKPDLTANHEAFMNEVAKRFAEVVAQTQVVDSPLDSSPLSRSKNPLARNVFAFTSEPIKGFNLLMNAMDDLINAEKGSIRQKQAAAQMARTAVITLVGWAAEASISAAFQMIRDEDDDEGEIAKEFGVKFGKQMLSNAYNAVPYVGQAVDIILDAWKGYDFTDMGIAPLVEVIDSAKSVMDTLRNPENKSETFVKAGRDLVESMATFFGIPIRNFNRDVVAGLRLFFHSTNLYTAEYEMQKWFYNPKSSTAREKHEFNSLLTDAYLSGNKKAFEHIYNDMRSMGLSPQTIMNGIAKDAYAQDITSTGSTLTRYTPGSDAWYIGMKGIFDRDLTAPDGLEKELTRLYKATEEKGVLPKYKSDSYTVDGEAKELSVKDHEAVLAEYSKLYYEIATILRNSPAYKNADDTLKAYWMAQAERYAGAISIYRVDSEYNLRTKWWEKMKDKPYYDVAGYIITNLKPSKEDE